MMTMYTLTGFDVNGKRTTVYIGAMNEECAIVIARRIYDLYDIKRVD